MRKWVLIGAGAVLLVGAIAVVSDLTGSNVPTNATTSTSELVGHHVRSFSLEGLKGGTIRAPWAMGHSSVLIFFASYCGPCQGEMPKIATYIRTHSPSPVEVLAVDAIDERSSAQTMIRKDNVTFPVAFDPNGNVTTGVFGFGQLPESVFVSSKGMVVKVYYGAIPERQLALGIKMLKESRA